MQVGIENNLGDLSAGTDAPLTVRSTGGLTLESFLDTRASSVFGAASIRAKAIDLQTAGNYLQGNVVGANVGVRFVNWLEPL
jgi:hypothetical protein